jgi:hypothetical protein
MWRLALATDSGSPENFGRVKLGSGVPFAMSPLYPRERTSSGCSGMSEKCHDRTFAQGCELAFIIIDDKGNDFFTELNLG